MHPKYNATSLYRVWTGPNTAHEVTYTRGVFNLARTGRFICYEQAAAQVRPVEVRLKCACGFDLGWVAVVDLQAEGSYLCDACGAEVSDHMPTSVAPPRTWQMVAHEAVNTVRDDPVAALGKYIELSTYVNESQIGVAQPHTFIAHLLAEAKRYYAIYHPNLLERLQWLRR